jgi:hypothetical protein
MDTPLKRLASFLAIAVLRGDNRIECGMVTDEHRPVTNRGCNLASSDES